MVAYAKQPYITPLEYLEREHTAETRSEYHNGVIVPREDASLAHVTITTNLIAFLGAQLKGSVCEPFTSQMRMKIPACNCYYYPDMSVACGGSQFENVGGAYSLLNPTLIVEVLSDTTEKTDRGDKFLCYQTLDSLQTYVLVAQERPQVEAYTRNSDGKWEYARFTGLEAALDLPSIGCTLRLADVYARVEFPPAPVTDVDLPE